MATPGAMHESGVRARRRIFRGLPLLWLACALVLLAPPFEALAERGAIGDATLSDAAKLIAAASADRVDVLYFLLERGVSPNAATKNGRTALHAAVRGGAGDALDFLIGRGADPNRSGKDGWTPLMEAAFGERENAAERLIKASAKLELREARNGLTALHVAARGNAPGLVSRLLAAGAQINVADHGRGLTALHYALASQKKRAMQIVGELLVSDADADVGANDGWTPLMAAVASGDARRVVLMLSYAKAIDAATRQGASALTIAAEDGRKEIAKVLVAAGAKMKPVRKGAQTPLNAALKGGHFDLVVDFIARGADVNLPGAKGRRPLELVAIAGDQRSLELLLARGADVNARNVKDGTTALMWAANNGHMASVKRLLNAGADPSLTANDGWTAYEAARMAGHENLARLLGGDI